MGVQGLTHLLLNKTRARQRVCLRTQQPAPHGQLLLVDASAMQFHFAEKLGMDWDDPEFNKALYTEASRFYSGVQRVGLEPVLVLDSACNPGHEQEQARRRVKAHAEGTIKGPTASMVMYHVYKDLGLRVEQSIHDADALLLALWHQHKNSVFALLTRDSDFMVFGVPKIVLAGDAVVDGAAVTFQFLNTLEAWRELSLYAALRKTRPGGAVPFSGTPNLLKRAQVAAILGNHRSRGVRVRLAAQRAGHGAKRSSVLSTTMAACEVLAREDSPLDVAFFRETLRMRSFDEQALQEFQGVVQEYVDTDGFARSPSALPQLKISPATLPWLPEPTVRMLDEEPLPGLMMGYACRGFNIPQHEPKECTALLQEMRRRAAAALAAPGAAVHEFCYITQTLQRLQAGEDPAAVAGTSAGPRAGDWFVPATHMPGVPVADATGSQSCSVPPLGATMQETAAAVQRACAEAGAQLQPSLAASYAVLLHALGAAGTATPSGPVQFRAASRELLLPGVPVYMLQQDEEAAVEEELPSEAESEAAKVVDVGSGLTTDDWNEIDDKGVVNSVRSSTGFQLMGKLQPFQAAAQRQVPALPSDKLFHLLYVLSQGTNGDAWKKLMKACFPTEYASTKEGDAKAAKARVKEMLATPKDTLMQELKKAADHSAGAAYALTWLGRLSAFVEGGGAAKEQAPWLLAVMKDAVVGGPESPQWSAAKACLGMASAAIKQAAKEEMWSGFNGMIGTGGKPMRYPQQQEVMDMVQEHLESAKAATSPPVPLHVILSTPTGSGKTFTAVMLHMHLLKQHYPDQILVYSVPTKQVLKRVGQECEAHGVVYWTAARDGIAYQVRRPYSIRTERTDKRTQASGTMHDELSMAASLGMRCNDIGGGHPSVIIADIDATAALMEAASQALPSSFYHASNLLLYLDEPNMGLELDPRVQHVVRRIMAHAPFTAILASATMPPSWDLLPRWWKGRGSAMRAAISLEPYGLPMSRLQIVSGSHSMRLQLNLLQLFSSYEEFHQAVNTNQRLRVLLLRHLSPQQANQLLLLQEGALGTGAVVEAEEDLVTLFGQDVSTLRESLEPQLAALSAEQFKRLRDTEWAEKPSYAPGGLLAAQSMQGVTLIATLHPREVALEVAGYGNKEAWGDAVRGMRAKVSVAVQAQRKQAKEQQRSRKKEEDDIRGGDEGAPLVTLRAGLQVDLHDAQGTDIDTLVMLSRGVAYTSSGDGQDPLVKRLYQQALLRVPEKAGVQPPLTRLVVDYSGIYGTDCPSVDHIIMHPSLGRLLSFDDHLQFIGRLRRDGVAIYPSLAMLRTATTGLRSEARDNELLGQGGAEAMRDTLAPLVVADPPCSAADMLAAARAKMQETDMSDTNALCGAWSAVSSGLQDKSADELKKVLVQRLRASAKVLGALATTPKMELALLRYMQRQCTQADRRHLADMFALMAQVLYDADVLSEDTILHWYHKGSDPAGREMFLPQAEKLVKWLEEQSEEDEEESD